MGKTTRVALVTGGGRGIGAAVAQQLAADGLAVVVSARTEAEITTVAAAIRDAGGEAHAITADVADAASVTALVGTTAAHYGPVDVLVNNAGVASSAPLKRTTLEEWERMMGVNATGTFLCTQACIEPMAASGWGRVINIASVAGKTGAAYVSAYTASKHAVVGFTRSVAAEYAASGVTVNALCPGYVDTPMTNSTLDRIESITGKSRDDALESILRSAPHGRLVTAQEIAGAVQWLVADSAASVNGQALVLDGGGFLA